jgi:hypothetical protein
LVKKQVVVQRDRFASFKLLKWIVEALERSSPQQAGVIPMEGPVVEGTEVVPVVVADVEQAQCSEQCPSAFNSFELPSWMLYQDVQLLWDSGLVRGESSYLL